MADTTDFVTTASIVTFGGATTAVWIISNAVRVAVHRYWPALPLMTGLAVAFVLASSTDHLHTLLDYFIAVVNGCLLYLTAMGVQQASNADVKGVEGARRHGKQPVTWRTPWIRVRKTPDVATAPANAGDAAVAVQEHVHSDGGGEKRG